MTYVASTNLAWGVLDIRSGEPVYWALNQALADMNGFDRRDHIGLRVRDVLSAGWPDIRPKLERAVEGGRYEGILNWVDAKGEKHVSCIVYESSEGYAAKPCGNCSSKGVVALVWEAGKRVPDPIWRVVRSHLRLEVFRLCEDSGCKEACL